MLNRVSEWLAEQLAADTGYTGVLFRNAAVAERDEEFVVEYCGLEWELVELADCIPRGWRLPSRPQTGIGRNVGLFQSLMKFAGSRPNADRDLKLAADRLRVATTASSPARYRGRK